MQAGLPVSRVKNLQPAAGMGTLQPQKLWPSHSFHRLFAGSKGFGATGSRVPFLTTAMPKFPLV